MENVLRAGQLLQNICIAAGGFLAVWSLYSMFSERSKGQQIDDKHWWQLLGGAFLAIVGSSNFIVDALRGLTF